MWGPFGVDVFVDGKICRIDEEVEEEEENQGWGGKITKNCGGGGKSRMRRSWKKIKIVEEGIQEWGGKIMKLWGGRKNVKTAKEGIKKLKRKRENNKIVEEEENKNERGRGK